MPHRSADGRPLVEHATAGELHLLELGPGPTSATSPAVGVEVSVLRSGVVRVVHWIAGERSVRCP